MVGDDIMASAPRGHVLALLLDIKENPHEDGLRLILADWLEEYGDALDHVRAELIRCQIHHAQLPASVPDKHTVGRRARWLMQKHGPAWLGPLEQWLSGWTFCRGLLSVSVSIESLRGQNMALLAASETWAWVDEIYLLGAGDADIARLRGCALLESVGCVGFRRSTLRTAGVQALSGLPMARRWRGLDLSGCPLGDAGVEALAQAEAWAGLQSLNLSSCDLDWQSGRHLANRREWQQIEFPLPKLQQLILWGNRLGNEGIRRLTRGGWGRLRSLDLRGNQIGDDGGEALAAWATLSSTRHLDLSDNQIGPRGANALARSQFLEQIESLSLWGNSLGQDALTRLRERFGSRLHAALPLPGLG
jgi:uncharacterized protein (TIGR02996 family)